MSASVVVSNSLLCSNESFGKKSFYLHNSLGVLVQLSKGRRNLDGLVSNAKKRHSKKRSWWRKFFFDDDGNWLGLKEDDLVEGEELEGEELSEGEKFEAWRRRAEAIIELREAQEDVRNEEQRKWEDWLVEEKYDSNSSSWVPDEENRVGMFGEDAEGDPTEMFPGKGLAESVRDLILGREDDDLLYEDRVFRYVKTVPLAAEILDVRRHQKLEMIKELKIEKERFRFEVEIGKSPPLSDGEVYVELRQRA